MLLSKCTSLRHCLFDRLGVSKRFRFARLKKELCALTNQTHTADPYRAKHNDGRVNLYFEQWFVAKRAGLFVGYRTPGDKPRNHKHRHPHAAAQRLRCQAGHMRSLHYCRVPIKCVTRHICQAALDTFIVVAILSFVLGVVFLVLLRFFIGVCVWLAVAATVVMFFFFGFFLFVKSNQCSGAGILDTGHQVRA